MAYLLIYLIIGLILSQLSFLDHKRTTDRRKWYIHYIPITCIYTCTWIILYPLLLLFCKTISRDLFYWSAGLLVFILAFYK